MLFRSYGNERVFSCRHLQADVSEFVIPVFLSYGDVEQILGRILRLPHTSQHTQSALNMSYVLTSSNDFNNTVAHIVKGLSLIHI